MKEVHWLVGMLLYGSGLRLTECLELRIKDIDFGYKQIAVRNLKGEKDRTTMLPEKDLKNGYGTVYLPYAIERKYSNAKYDWFWQYVFPAARISTDPRTGIQRRHHLYDTIIQKAVK